MSEVIFSNRTLRRFAETVALELGAEQFNAILSLSNLPNDWRNPASFMKLSPEDAAHVYAALQAAMRIYFGRGARGVLLRVGQRMWSQLLEEAPLASKAQAALIKRLPLTARRKPTLELLARLLGGRPGDLSLHTLDLDLLLVDHASPSTHDQHETYPICYVTQGLITESLFWSMGQGHDVEEVSCKARGEDSCEFKITLEK